MASSGPIPRQSVEPHHLLAFNSGSSSLKFALYEFSNSSEPLLVRGEAENIGAPSARLWLRAPDGSSVVDQPRPIPERQYALQMALDELKKGTYVAPSAIGHRVVNGGPHYA